MRTLLLVAALSAASPALAGPGHDPGLVTLLSAYHEAPTAEALMSFRPGLRPKLEAILDDDALPRLTRLRALTALGLEASPEAFARVAAVLADLQADTRLRMGAATTLGRYFANFPDVAFHLQAGLSSPEAGLRELCVSALAEVATPAAFEILSRHRVIERHVTVRKALRDALLLEQGLTPLAPEGRLIPEVRR